MESNDNNEKSGVAKLRELFYEIKRKQKPSPELEEAVRDKTPRKEIAAPEADKKKIAKPNPREGLDL